MTKRTAETAAQREKRGAANPKRTQDARDFAAFVRYARNYPKEAVERARAAVAFAPTRD